MTTKRLKKLMGACSLIAGLFLMVSGSNDLYAAGDEYPNRAISLVVPSPPGGSTDLSARLLAEFMEKYLKQPVAVVNKPGAAGTIGGYAVASAKPDGYTLGHVMSSTPIPEVFSYFYSAPYSSSDLRPISRVHVLALAIVVKGDAPWNSLKELIEFARSNPRMKYGHNGKSLVQYMVMTSIAKTEKLSLVDVPFDGDGKQIPALLGGHIPVAVVAISSVTSLWEAKKVKILAALTEKRPDFAPQVPSLVELGYKLPYPAFVCLCAPKGTPTEVVRKLDEVVRKISEDQDYINKSTKLNLLLAYQDTATFEKSLIRLKEELQTFFKEEGLVK
jgi:tripartite-type tricarboxylate transporter receptor subunit TctC